MPILVHTFRKDIPTGFDTGAGIGIGTDVVRVYNSSKAVGVNNRFVVHLHRNIPSFTDQKAWSYAGTLCLLVYLIVSMCMVAGLGRPSCLPHSRILMGAGLAGRPPCPPHSRILMDPYGCWVSWETSLSTTQSGPYGCWVSWGTSLSTTQSGPYGCWVSWETSLSTTQSGPYGS